MVPARQLVLELVLQCVSDVKTMVACTLVSTEIKQHTHRAVKGNLPALISACHYRPYEHDSKPKKHQPFLWLRGVAGDSWRSFEAGCAMLEKVMERDPRPAAAFLVDIGLQLTCELLMHLMRQRKHQPNLLAAYLDHKGAAANMPTVYMEAATWGWCWTNGNLCRHVRKSVDYLVAQVKPAQLPDVLLLLVLQAVNEQPAADAALALIQHDKEVLHVLHTGRSAGSSGTSSSSSSASSSSQGGGDSSQEGSNGVPGCTVKWCNVSSKAARNKETSQQQQQLTQQEAVGLVQEVLTVCVTYDMAELCQAVAALPAAKQIGAAKVMQLLYVAFMQLKKRPHYSGPSMPVLEALIALPGAADVSPECFEHLLHLCVLKQDGTKLGPMLKLPCVQQLSGQQLCRMIHSMGKAGFKDQAQQLCGFAEGRPLPREDLMELITKLLMEPWDYPYNSITRCLEAIEVLRPGEILTGDDMLTLMEVCVGCSRYREGWDALVVMAKWLSAAADVTDVPRFMAVVKAATTCWHPDSGMGVVTCLLSAMPISKQLQPSDWVMLVKSMLLHHEGEGFLKWVLQQQPELQHMGTKDLLQLLTVAATRDHSCAAAMLAALPAAQRLGCGDLAELLITGARVSEGSQTMQAIRGLPGVEQLGSSVLADALMRAVLHGGAATAEMLTSLPAAQRLEGAVVGELLLTAAKQGPACIDVIISLPAASEAQPGVLAEALSALLAQFKKAGKHGDGRRDITEAFKQLCALPLARQMPREAVQQLFDGATDMGRAGAGLLVSVSQLPQAARMQAQLTRERLLPLLKQAVDIHTYCRSAKTAESLRQLLLQPAAQEVGGADMVELLKIVAVNKYKEAFTGLQQLRGFRQLDTQAVVGMMQWTLQEYPQGMVLSQDPCWMEAYVQHPAAASITAEQLTQLLTKGVQKSWGSKESYQVLMQLPTLRQLDAAAWEELIRVCIRKSDMAVLLILLKQPDIGSIDANGAARLLDAAMTRDNDYPGAYEARFTRAIVTGLPAIADIDAEQMLKVLWATIMSGREHVTEALAEAPVFPEAVAKGGVEFAALCGAVKLLKGRKYTDLTDLDV